MTTVRSLWTALKIDEPFLAAKKKNTNDKFKTMPKHLGIYDSES